MAADEAEKAREPVFRDIRRYYCEFCGICRSKKALIAAHIRTHHEVTSFDLDRFDLNCGVFELELGLRVLLMKFYDLLCSLL